MSAREPSPARSTPLVACSDCDLLLNRKAIDPGDVALCPRCGARLYRGRHSRRQRALAYLLACVVLWVAANALPFLTFAGGGTVRRSRLISGVFELYAQGYAFLAVVVFVACIAAPLIIMTGLFLVLAPRRGSFRLRRWLEALRPWAMLDVFLLGVLVAIVRLSELAELSLETGFFAYIGLVLVSTLAALSTENLLVDRQTKHQH